jgi:hypothetical protein
MTKNIDQELIDFRREHCPPEHQECCIVYEPGMPQDLTCRWFGFGSAGCLHPEHPSRRTIETEYLREDIIPDAPSVSPYVRAAVRIGNLVARKNAAYGDSFARAPEIIRILYPDGIRPDQVDDLLAVVRILDKMSRIATDKSALGEDPWRDIAGYALLMNVESPR